MKVAVYGLKLDKESADYFCKLYQIALEHNLELYIAESFDQQIKKIPQFRRSKFFTFNSYECLKKIRPSYFFTFGGDGTILKGITLIKDLEIPIIGINTGRLGFLASIHKDDFIQNIEEILQGNFLESKRCILELSEPTSVLDFPYALNEFAITRKETTSMITVETYINGQFLNTFWADGLIVSTPTGSTGYSLSCGGPIISPESNSLVVTPIAPHNLNARPLIINDDSEITLKISSRVPEFSLSLDSRLLSLPITQKLTLKKAKFSIILGQSKNQTYYDTLRKKLLWGLDSRN